MVKIVLTLLLIIVVLCGQAYAQMIINWDVDIVPESEAQKTAPFEPCLTCKKESFDLFFALFAEDSDFQMANIAFPLKETTITSETLESGIFQVTYYSQPKTDEYPIFLTKKQQTEARLILHQGLSKELRAYYAQFGLDLNDKEGVGLYGDGFGFSIL